MACSAKTADEKIVAYIEFQVKNGAKLDDVLRSLQYVKKSEALKTADIIQRRGETVHLGKIPKSMMGTKEIATVLGIKRLNVVATLKRFKCNGVLYRNENTMHICRYYDRRDIERVLQIMETLHKKIGPVIAFNPNVKNGKVYHYISVYHCRSRMNKDFGTNFSIYDIKEMIITGNSKDNWFVEELA